MTRLTNLRSLVTVTLIGICLAGLAPDLQAAGETSLEAATKVVASQLMSGDDQKVQEAFATIRQSFAKDPFGTSNAVILKWNAPLFFSKRYDEIAALAQELVLYNTPNDSQIENSLKMRIRALLATGRHEEALVSAKSLYNVAGMRTTSEAVDLVAQALNQAYKDQPGFGRKFRIQQMESASTNQTVEAAPRMPSMLANIKVDGRIYEAGIQKILNQEAVSVRDLLALGNLYLLSDQPKKAEEVYSRIYDMADQTTLAPAIEGTARALRAQDGNLARANAYIIAQRNKAQ